MSATFPLLLPFIAGQGRRLALRFFEGGRPTPPIRPICATNNGQIRRPPLCANPGRYAFCHGTHSRTLNIRHQTYGMHVARVAETTGVVGKVKCQLPPDHARAL